MGERTTQIVLRNRCVETLSVRIADHSTAICGALPTLGLCTLDLTAEAFPLGVTVQREPLMDLPNDVFLLYLFR